MMTILKKTAQAFAPIGKTVTKRTIKPANTQVQGALRPGHLLAKEAYAADRATD